MTTVLGESRAPRKRGEGKTLGHVMAALGDRPAAKITTREIDEPPGDEADEGIRTLDLRHGKATL